ncbi:MULTISPECIES: ankyrin repeat domain-containing protein [unclassified Cytobacillus]|uniref:ankyrin repeat domain-containing protein n=1 Tax=unclassified Cytobacillus TaxID=2675268 RepID=UPI0013572790|nr:ankyrin repeat domain-containing protein [Cytobacillus sp. AMY 15.2]KAF0820538.1 putative ankyrin repeat protein YahD [Bacillus sp. ZZV12-4809]MCM3090430.1 ankyrin repeat domain-containing protein [Cytobacillus sp. AMY 15.2]
MLKIEDSLALFEAAKNGDLECLKAFIENGINMNLQDKKKRTAILIASMNKHYDVVRYLAESGADINLQDQTSLNPFLYGCIHGDLKLVKIMISAGADINLLTRFGGVGLTPACEKGHIEVVRELLTSTDINVNHTNYCGWTPLIEAIVLNDGGKTQQDIIKLLLEHGADPSLTDQYGVRPIELARRKGYKEIEDILFTASIE